MNIEKNAKNIVKDFFTQPSDYLLSDLYEKVLEDCQATYSCGKINMKSEAHAGDFTLEEIAHLLYAIYDEVSKLETQGLLVRKGQTKRTLTPDSNGYLLEPYIYSDLEKDTSKVTYLGRKSPFVVFEQTQECCKCFRKCWFECILKALVLIFIGLTISCLFFSYPKAVKLVPCDKCFIQDSAIVATQLHVDSIE